MTVTVSEARWDWYQGTVMDDVAAHRPQDLVDHLQEVLGAPSRTDTAGRWGYATTATLRSPEGDVAALVYYGGSQLWPSVQGSGAASTAVADALRAGMRHRVSRADSALDWCGEGAWESLFETCKALADERHLVLGTAGDWVRGEKGKTLYVGSKSSAVFLRLYQKGLQLGEDPNWVRAELVIRPQKEGRWAVAGMSPDEVWGLSPWARELRAALTGLSVPRRVMTTWSKGDDDRALQVMFHQYGAVLARKWHRIGSDDGFMRYVLEALLAS